MKAAGLSLLRRSAIQESGFYYLQSRYYDLSIGRFINCDNQFSTDLEDGLNLFAYCRNNPVNMCDHTGHWPQWIKDAANWVNENVLKPAAEVVVNMAETVWSFAKNVTVEVGYGTGLSISASVAGLTGDVGYDLSMTFQGSINSGVDLGVKETYSAVIGVKGIDGMSIGYENSLFHSVFCDRYDEYPGHSQTKCPNAVVNSSPTITLVGVGVYFLVGIKASVGFDYQPFFSDLERIWIE